MARTPKRFYGPALIATGPATVFTASALTKCVLRHIHISNPTTSAATFTLSIGADAAGTRLFQTYSVAAGAVFDFFCYLIVDAAEIIQMAAGTNNVMTVTIDGDEITLG